MCIARVGNIFGVTGIPSKEHPCFQQARTPGRL